MPCLAINSGGKSHVLSVTILMLVVISYPFFYNFGEVGILF